MAMSLTASAGTSMLFGGNRLYAGQRVTAPSCYYHLDFQGDGNLVIYAGPGSYHPIWATGTVGSGAYAVMQADGNFVVYNWNDIPVWSSRTAGVWYDFLSMQDDGNAVIYDYAWFPHWASNTVGQAPIQTPCTGPSVITIPEPDNTDLYGGDYAGFFIGQPKVSWCAYYCATDSRCKAYTYVPPGYYGSQAACFKKDSVPSASYHFGMFSGRILRD